MKTQMSIYVLLFTMNFFLICGAQTPFQDIQGHFELNEKELLFVSNNTITWWKWPDVRRIFNLHFISTSGVERLVKFQEKDNHLFWNAFLVKTKDGFWIRNGLMQATTQHGAQLAQFWIPELGFEVKRTDRALPLTPSKCVDFSGTYTIDENRIFIIEQRKCYYLKMTYEKTDSAGYRPSEKVEKSITAEGRELNVVPIDLIPYFENWDKHSLLGSNQPSRHKTTMTETSLLRDIEFTQGQRLQTQFNLSESPCGQNTKGLEVKIDRKSFPYDPNPEHLCLALKRSKE